MKHFLKAIALALVCSVGLLAQTATTNTTLTTAIGQTTTRLTVGSTTGIVASSVGSDSLIMLNKEVMKVTSVPSSTVLVVQRAQKGTGGSAHIAGAVVWAGPPSVFPTGDPVRGSTCTAANQPYLPVVSLATGAVWTCSKAGTWGQDMIQYVSPSQCSAAPTTLTTTNTYTYLGASTVFVFNSTTNAATGTLTLTCNIVLPTVVGTSNGRLLEDITLFVGSQTTAPSALGTSTLASITFPAAATTETASTVTPVAVGGTVTTTSPTALTTATTAGAFLTVKHTYASVIRLSTDLQILQYTLPFTNGSAAAMTINTPGLLVHYVID